MPIFVLLALLGCGLGRWLGRPLRTCPYRLSGQMSASLPILAGLASGSGLSGLRSILVGVGALLGVFASGHNSRLRALGFCALGSTLGHFAGGWLG